MTIKEALNEYQFNNVGQFKGIAQSLGYREEYNSGFLCFTLNGEEFRTTVHEIRSHTQTKFDETVKKDSMERICKFFDKDKTLLSDYSDILRGKGVDIINWGNIGSDSKDRFTVIDHTNKICYAGKDLYDHALMNGYLLDGKGTKLEKGALSDLTEVKGKPAKLRITEKGVSVFYKKETLVIPDKILGKKLSEKQRKALLEGEIIVIPAKRGSMFVQVDKDLNSVIVRSEKELSIPAKIGERELTTTDKYLLVNGYSLDNMIIHNEEGYFIADISWTDDKKGIVFKNMQSIPEAKAKELLDKQQDKDNISTVEKEQTVVNDLKGRDMEAELKEAIEKDDFEKMSQLRDEGYKPSEEVIRGLSNSPNMDDKKAVVIDKLFGMKPEVPDTESSSTKNKPNQEEVKEASELVNGTPEQDVTFKSAVENGDFAKLDLLKGEGYMPSKEVMQSLAGSVPENSMIAVQKIFGLKSNAQSIGEVKLAQGSQNNSRDVSRGVGNIVNKAFSDL